MDLVYLKARGFPEVCVRPDTSDLDVFAQVFVYEMYKEAADRAPPGTVLDLGAYTGLSTAYFLARGFDVVAYEADEGNLHCYGENTIYRKHGYGKHGQALLNRCVVGSGKMVRFHRDEAEPWASSASIPGQEGEEVESHPLDISDNCPVSLVKMNIEGGEVDLLSLPRNVEILRRATVITAELHDRFLPGCTKAYLEAFEGYDHYWRDDAHVLSVVA